MLRRSVIYSFVVGLLLLQACSSDDVGIPICEDCQFTCLDGSELNIITNDCIENWECNFNVLPNSKVDKNQVEGSASGSKNVFQIINRKPEGPDGADGEFTNILVFELDESQTSFSVEGSELSLLNIHFNRICYCSDVGFREFVTGCMQGEYRENTWYVQGNLIITFDFGDIEFKFDAKFVN